MIASSGYKSVVLAYESTCKGLTLPKSSNSLGGRISLAQSDDSSMSSDLVVSPPTGPAVVLMVKDVNMGEGNDGFGGGGGGGGAASLKAFGLGFVFRKR